MSRGVDAQCLCGHRHPEHSICGPCHGCRNCDDDDPRAEYRHEYVRCGCTVFQLATGFDLEPLLLERPA